MSLFQPSVLKKYLSDLDTAKVRVAYEQFRAHFADPAKQENIRNAKEEQYQEGFLRELFVDTLGYTLHPAPGYNLTTEFKNLTDAKKADGAILLHDAAIAVIELKGTNTTDFKKIEEQAFRYKNNHKGCRYVVTSNFERLRFYVDDATEYEEFDLFNLDSEAFALLYLCLAKSHVLAHLPADIKARSVTQEEQITRKLYADYSDFKRKLFTDLSARNPQHDRLLLFKKTQKLLDRLLFIFFAEDRGLLPPNSIHDILIQWQELRDKYDEPVSLYSRFQKYFGYLNTGHKGQKYDVFGYNGGLFAPDDVLDSVTIDDTVLFNGAWALTRYDFVTEVDVNILGHIFEHSLNEIEEIQAEIEGRAVDKGKTKRKKDGVFYTPKYITRYIVENTVGALCRQKQAELGLREEDYADRAAAKKKRKELSERLHAYQTWLEGITILDPACGSGAFLNQAFNFLSEEHARLDRLRATLFGDALVLRDTDLGILEHNLFGVDLNDESVEIAQLSLWLRTAKKGRKLSALSQHIRVGNSLISDPAVAGDKAFDWQAAFPQVFAKGGFDVVVGNPPYVDIKGMESSLVKALFTNYSTSENRINLYSIFIEKGYQLLRQGGILSFINPNSMLMNSSYEKLRRLILSDLVKIVKLPDNVFEEAKVETIIFEVQKGNEVSFCQTIVYGKNETISGIDDNLTLSVDKQKWRNGFNLYAGAIELDILSKCQVNSTRLGDIADFTLGITPYDKYQGHSEEIIKSRAFHSKIKIDETYKPLITGENIVRFWVKPRVEEYIRYGDWLGAKREERFFTQPRILIRQIVSGNPPRIFAAYTDLPYYFTQIGFGIILKNSKLNDHKFLLSLLNSKLMTYYHKFKFLDLEKELFQKILIANCKEFPIRLLPLSEQKPFAEKVDTISKHIVELDSLTTRFLRLLTSKHPALALTKKLEDWPSLSFGDFLKEVKKQKIAWSLQEEAGWMDYFSQEQSAAKALRNDIERTDRAIDAMVYALYGLTPEEVAVVEGTQTL